jgi:hypothetical protein
MKDKIRIAGFWNNIFRSFIGFRKLNLVVIEKEKVFLFTSIDRAINHFQKNRCKKAIPELEKLRIKIEKEKKKWIVRVTEENDIIEYSCFEELSELINNTRDTKFRPVKNNESIFNVQIQN